MTIKFDIQSVFLKYAQWISMILILFFFLLILVEWSTLFFSPLTKLAAPEATKEWQLGVKQNSTDAILHSSLFGVYVSNNLSSVKKSMLNVTLVGILFATQMDLSQVIIRQANGEEKTYKLSDTIPGGAVIKRIMANGILVERQGAIESLSLPKSELIFEPVAKDLKINDHY